MNSPPKPRRWSPEPTQPTQASAGRSISDKWTEQMAGIANKRNDYNDAFERLAAQEAQREAEQLREVANNQQPQIIDLDSDSEEDSRPKSMIPSPPRLSSYPPRY